MINLDHFQLNSETLLTFNFEFELDLITWSSIPPGPILDNENLQTFLKDNIQ